MHIARPFWSGGLWICRWVIGYAGSASFIVIGDAIAGFILQPTRPGWSKGKRGHEGKTASEGKTGSAPVLTRNEALCVQVQPALTPTPPEVSQGERGYMPNRVRR